MASDQPRNLSDQPADLGQQDLPPTTLNISDLVDAARDVIAGVLGDETEKQNALQQILAIGTSAGGARAKAVMNVHPDTKEMRPGQKPIPGYEGWLLKFDGARLVVQAS